MFHGGMTIPATIYGHGLALDSKHNFAIMQLDLLDALVVSVRNWRSEIQGLSRPERDLQHFFICKTTVTFLSLL